MHFRHTITNKQIILSFHNSFEHKKLIIKNDKIILNMLETITTNTYNEIVNMLKEVPTTCSAMMNFNINSFHIPLFT